MDWPRSPGTARRHFLAGRLTITGVDVTTTAHVNSPGDQDDSIRAEFMTDGHRH
jgi:hypothetical protein